MSTLITDRPGIPPSTDDPFRLSGVPAAIHLAREHLAAFRWHDAEAAARAAIELQPASAEAHVLLGEARRELWRLDDAKAAFEQARTLDRTNGDAWAGLGFIEVVRGRLDEGIESCRQATQVRSDLSAPYRFTASALLAQGQPSRAAAAALEARRLAPRVGENSIVLAAAWFRSGLRAGALRLIDGVIRDHPKRAEAYVTRAAFRLAIGEVAAAIGDLERGLAEKPWLPPAYSLLARMHAHQRRPSDALQAIRRARQFNPFSEEYLSLEAEWLATAGDSAAALALIEAEWWRHPKSRELRALAGMLALQSNRLDLARRYISGLIASATADQAWLRLAALWGELGTDHDHRALTCLRQAALSSDVAEPIRQRVQFEMAQLLARTEQPEAALTQLAGLDSAASRMLEARLLERLDRKDAAAQALARVIHADPANAECIMQLGSLMRAQGDREASERHLRRAVALAPDEPTAHEQLAILLSDKGEFDESLTLFRRAAELSLGAPAVRLNIAVLLARQKRWPEAEQVFRQVLQADPLNISALGKLGQVLSEQKRWAEAAEIFEWAIERAPDDPGPRLSLVNALRSQHRVEAAAAAARQWTEDLPAQFVAWSLLARQLAALKHPDAEAMRGSGMGARARHAAGVRDAG